LRELGEIPGTVKGQRAWRQAAAKVEQFRERHQITDPDRALGPNPRCDLEQRRHRRATHQAIEQLQSSSAPTADSASTDVSVTTSTRRSRDLQEPAQSGSMSMSAAARRATPPSVGSGLAVLLSGESAT
jgi:hypothetical protein